MAEQPSLGVCPGREAGERAVGPDHAMAGDDDRNRIAPVGRADRAGLAGVAEAPGLLAVADRLSVRDLPEHPPHSLLERRAAWIEGEIERRSHAGEIFSELVGRDAEDRGGLGQGGERGRG